MNEEKTLSSDSDSKPFPTQPNVNIIHKKKGNLKTKNNKNTKINYADINDSMLIK